MASGKAYIEQFHKLRCAPDLLLSRAFPNAKEITEAFAMRSAVTRFLADEYPIKDPNIHLFAVGDGRTPRAAVTFAFTTAWMCWSVDPNAGDWNPRVPVERVIVVPCRVEDLMKEESGWIGGPPDKSVVILCHAHVQPDAALRGLGLQQAAVVAMPCCTHPSDRWPWTAPHIAYKDPDVWSPQNWVHVWKDLRA